MCRGKSQAIYLNYTNIMIPSGVHHISNIYFLLLKVIAFNFDSSRGISTDNNSHFLRMK